MNSTNIKSSIGHNTMEAFISMYASHIRKFPYLNGAIKREIHKKTIVLVSGKKAHETALLNLLGKGMSDCYIEEHEAEETAVNWISEAIETAVSDLDKDVIWIHSADMSARAVSQIKNFALLNGINLADTTYGDCGSGEQEGFSEVCNDTVDAFFIIKEVGAATERKVQLEDIVRIAQKTRKNCRVVHVELQRESTGCDTDNHTFVRIRNSSRCTSYQELSVTDLTNHIFEEACNDTLTVRTGDRVVVDLRSCVGAVPVDIPFLICELNYNLKEMGINVHCFTNKHGYATGATTEITVSIMKLDDELQPLWDDTASSPGYSSITF